MAITFKGRFREQFNVLSSEQKKFIRALARVGDGQDIGTLNNTAVLAEIVKEDSTFTAEKLSNTIDSLRCIH